MPILYQFRSAPEYVSRRTYAVVVYTSVSMSNVEFVEEPACWWTCDQQCDDGDDALSVECHVRKGDLSL
jgi:hypothetical protein